MEKKSYSFGSISYDELCKIVPIQREDQPEKFDEWFGAGYDLTNEEIDFLEKLIKKHKLYLPHYAEEDLKMKFIAFVLDKVNFLEIGVLDWYEAGITAEVNGIELKGFVDYVVAKGNKDPQRPYFFIQEFKHTEANKDVEDQLLAELVAAINLNKVSIMRGAFIISQYWKFMIVEKDEADVYHLYVSESFDCLKTRELQLIYKHLQQVKLKYCKD